MMESYGREYEAQAKHISDLRAQNIKLQHRNTELELKYADAIFYKSLAAAIHKHESLQDPWVEFMTLLRLCEPSLEEQTMKEIERYEARLWHKF